MRDAGVATVDQPKKDRSRFGRADDVVIPATQTPLSVWVILFMISVALPLIFYVGPIRLSAYRLIVFGMFVPLFLRWLTGGAGGVVKADIFLMLSAVWAAIALAKAHGADAIEPIGAGAMELLSPYLLARNFIRTPEHFRQMVRLLAGMILFLIPFAWIEAVLDINVISRAFDAIGTVARQDNNDVRMGLWRVQGPFEHPILFGVFCSTAIALTFCVLTPNRGSIAKLFLPTVSFMNTFLSLSSGPVIAALVQIGLLLWGAVVAVKARWWLLVGLIVCAYIAIDILSNRTPFQVFIHYATFNHGTAYARIHIFNYGSASVMNHPFFGIGLNMWERPNWVPDSMDNFWLLYAVRYGMPGFLLLVFAIGSIYWGICSQRGLSEEVQRYRIGLLITLTAIFLAISSVHLWNATFCWLMFLIGSGVWMYNEPPVAPSAEGEEDTDETQGRQSRSGARRQTARR